MTAQDQPSTRPYFIRALHEWCTDHGLTPYLVVHADDSVQVPHDFVHDGEIVLNISYDATQSLQLGNEFIAFKARFGGRPHDIMVPVGRVAAIYARENGQGMAFPVEPAQPDAMAGAAAANAAPGESPLTSVPSVSDGGTEASQNPPDPAPTAPGTTPGRPSLRRIK